MVKLHVIFQWLPIAIIPLLIIIVVGLSYWIFARQRRRNQKLNSNKLEKVPTSIQPIHQPTLSQNKYVSSPTRILTKKSKSTNSIQLTNADIAYLSKILRTASDRPMWKHDYLTKDHHNKLRKLPSGQIQQKELFFNEI